MEENNVNLGNGVDGSQTIKRESKFRGRCNVVSRCDATRCIYSVYDFRVIVYPDDEYITDFDMPTEDITRGLREFRMFLARLKARALNREPMTRSDEAFCGLVNIIMPLFEEEK